MFKDPKIPPQEDLTKLGNAEGDTRIGAEQSRKKNWELYKTSCLLEQAEGAVHDKLTI